MPLAQPVSLSHAAWAALRDGLVEPARARAAPAEVVPLARLAATWSEATADGERVTVFLSPDDAAALADHAEAQALYRRAGFTRSHGYVHRALG